MCHVNYMHYVLRFVFLPQVVFDVTFRLFASPLVFLDLVIVCLYKAWCYDCRQIFLWFHTSDQRNSILFRAISYVSRALL